MLKKDKLKIYLPFALVAGVVGYAIYVRLAERENTQLADKMPRKRTRKQRTEEIQAIKKDKAMSGNYTH